MRSGLRAGQLVGPIRTDPGLIRVRYGGRDRGGAVRGIDEKLSTNLATGTASFAILIATSHGRAGS
ncbi:MAG TPA: hypothetical protein VH165_11760, partial [Kofleriaceae bacterium]|nr:hypothetical protein [Kofleriaceae bacterium]